MSITNILLEKRARELNLPLVGIFSKDALPRKKQPGGYIFNLQDSTDENGIPLPGTHWTAAWVDPTGKAVYCDSFGFLPPEQVENFLGRPLAWSNMQIQSLTSEVCGYYCLYFLYWMSHNRKVPIYKRLQLYMRQFSENPYENLRRLKRYIRPL